MLKIKTKNKIIHFLGILITLGFLVIRRKLQLEGYLEIHWIRKKVVVYLEIHQIPLQAVGFSVIQPIQQIIALDFSVIQQFQLKVTVDYLDQVIIIDQILGNHRVFFLALILLHQILL